MFVYTHRMRCARCAPHGTATQRTASRVNEPLVTVVDHFCDRSAVGVYTVHSITFEQNDCDLDIRCVINHDAIQVMLAGQDNRSKFTAVGSGYS